jgi:hypothetical protein
VSQIDDPTYKICEALTKILQPLSTSGRSFIRNSLDLKELLKNVQVDQDCLLASLDVVGLYPNIPLKPALECIREELNNDETLGSRTESKVDDIMKLLEICLETHFKTLDGRIWTQTDGCPIGKSISGEIAEIYMNWFEKSFVFNPENDYKPVFWKRMRDDIFVIWKNKDACTNKRLGSDDLDRFLWSLNGKERKIQFTLEREVDSALPFLDIVDYQERRWFYHESIPERNTYPISHSCSRRKLGCASVIWVRLG